MDNIKKPISELNKKEFDKAYEDMLVNYKDKFNKYPLPTKEEILQFAIYAKQITMEKYLEFIGNGR